METVTSQFTPHVLTVALCNEPEQNTTTTTTMLAIYQLQDVWLALLDLIRSLELKFSITAPQPPNLLSYKIVDVDVIATYWPGTSGGAFKVVFLVFVWTQIFCQTKTTWTISVQNKICSKVDEA